MPFLILVTSIYDDEKLLGCWVVPTFDNITTRLKKEADSLLRDLCKYHILDLEKYNSDRIQLNSK